MPENGPYTKRAQIRRWSPFAATTAAALMLATFTFLLATLTPIAGPAAPVPKTAEISAAVINDLGQLRWVTTTPAPLTPLEAEGRRLYEHSHCAFCHSQYAEPASSEARRWGR